MTAPPERSGATLLEPLTPIERAVFMREVFDYDYAEIATAVGQAEANCRQTSDSCVGRDSWINKMSGARKADQKSSRP